MELIFRTSPHHLDSLINENEIPASSLTVLGQTLIVRNVSIARKALDIESIKIPDQFPNSLRLVRDNFPAINVEGFYDEMNDNTVKGNPTGYARHMIIGRDITKEGKVEVPINSLLHYGINQGNNKYSSVDETDGNLLVEPIVYPWDLLNSIKKVLRKEVTHTVVSPNASIAESSIINGPCIVEDDVSIDDFCKIKGPAYIGCRSFIGTSSVIEESIIESNTKIGFSCQMGGTYLAGDDEIAHLNVLLDSVIGKNVWIGGYSVTSNVSTSGLNIMCEIEGELINLGTTQFGSIIGNNCIIGTSVVLSAGKYIPADTVLQALGKTYQVSKRSN